MARVLVPEDLHRNGSRARDAAVVSVVRGIIAQALATFAQDRSGARIVRRQWPQDRQAIAIVERAASSPAMTTTAGWAAELAQTRVLDLLATFGPASCGAALLQQGTVLSWADAAKITIPGISTAGAGFTSFAAQGQAIAVRQLVTSAGVNLTPSKFATIFSLTRETIESSNSEQLVRMVLADSLGAALDAALFSTNAATASSPAGLLYNVTPITAATAGSSVAMLQDFGKLVQAVSPTCGMNIAFVTDPGTVTKIALSAAPGFELLGLPVLASNAVTVGSVICIGLPALVSAFEPTPRIDASRDVEIGMDTAPPADPGSGTTVVKSMYQTDTVAIRFIDDVAWGVRTPSAVAVVNGITW